MSMNEGGGSRLTKKQREMISLAVEATLLVAAFGLSAWAWSKKHTTNTVTTKTVVVQASPGASAQPTPTPAALGDTETVNEPIGTLAAGYKLTLTAPKTWRTVDVRSLVPIYDGYEGNDMLALLRFVPDHPERAQAPSVVQPVNSLDLLMTGSWVNRDEGDAATPANKHAFLSYLASLHTVADITQNKCTSYVSLGPGVCAEAKVRPQIIKTADGSLTGMAYLTMQTQSVSYDPQARVELVGTVGGKPVRVSGSFLIYDQLYQTVGSTTAAITNARSAYLGGNPPADTLEAYQRVLAVVQSMRFGK